MIVSRTTRGTWNAGGRAWLAMVSLLLFVASGCSSEKASVTGTVIRKDLSPVVNARVVVRDPSTGKSGSAFTDEEGRFALGTINKADGLHPGEYYLLVVEDRGNGETLRPRTIADKYEMPSRSGLSLAVSDGDSEQLELVLDPP